MLIHSQDATEFEFIINLVYERRRIRLHDGKQQLIRARLEKRLRARGLETLGEYCDYLRETNDEAELGRLADALTTNFTSFLRERDHFEFLIQTALPAVLHQRKEFGIWSAACATGEEPYTIAFSLWDHYPLASGWNWRVHATDISTEALQKARQAIYPEDRLSTLPTDWWRRFFQKAQGKRRRFYRVKPCVVERMAFQQFNLLGRYSFPEIFPVIFCRNVMIYFDRPTQEQLVKRLCERLQGQGYLIVGHSDTLDGLHVPLRCLRPSIYQKL